MYLTTEMEPADWMTGSQKIRTVEQLQSAKHEPNEYFNEFGQLIEQDRQKRNLKKVAFYCLKISLGKLPTGTGGKLV